MTMTLDSPSRSASSVPPAQRLRTSFAAARLSFTWFGVRKSLSPQQRAEAAESFGAEGPFLSAAKKLLDSKDPSYRALVSLKGRIGGYWKALSLPYPEPGLRLIRQQDVSSFDQQMRLFTQELAQAAEELDERYEDLKQAAAQRLGRLFDPADYPPSLRGLFAVAWEFPSVEPPQYLLQLDPQLYRQERARIAARFEEAVQMAEQAFTAEFSKLVSHLLERLSGAEDGQKKSFRDSSINHLREFFDRFRSLNVHSSAELESLVATAQAALGGAEPQALRDSEGLRQQIASELSAVAGRLDQLLVEAPRRKILRSGRSGAGS